MSIVDKAQLKIDLYERQRLYHQMIKDKITGPTVDKVQKEDRRDLKKVVSASKSKAVMKKEDFTVGAKFLIDDYKVPATIVWKSADSGDFAIETPTYASVNFQLSKRGIRMYTCFGTQMLYSKVIPYTSLILVTPNQNVDTFKV